MESTRFILMWLIKLTNFTRRRFEIKPRETKFRHFHETLRYVYEISQKFRFTELSFKPYTVLYVYVKI
jgi:hypothetical protein